MKLHTYHSKPFSHSYLLVCILSGLCFQPAWAETHSVMDTTIPVTGHPPVATPKLDNISPVVGQTLTVDPQFYDVDGDAVSLANTLYEWQVQDNPPNGPWRKIADAKPGSQGGANQYLVWTGYQGRSIRIGVRPGGNSSVVDPYLGEWAYSAGTAPVQGRAPEAKNVNITGTATVGQTLTGSYDFYDADGDIQGGSIFKWYRDGQEIPNATGKTYTIVREDQGHKLTFAVTPKSSSGNPDKGVEAKSSPSGVVQGRAPEAKNVRITYPGKYPGLGYGMAPLTLTLKYDYYDAEDDKQGASQITWKRNGSVVGQGPTYKLSSKYDMGSEITASVTPISLTGAPNVGLSVAAPSIPRIARFFVSEKGNWSQGSTHCVNVMGMDYPTVAEAQTISRDENMKGWLQDIIVGAYGYDEYLMWTKDRAFLRHTLIDYRSGLTDSSQSDNVKKAVVCYVR